MLFHRIAIPLICFFISSKSYSQNGYIATDSSILIGVKVIQFSYAKAPSYIIVEKSGKEIKYLANEITEFSTENGEIYESHYLKSIGNHAFLKRMVDGETKLLLYTRPSEKSFYIFKNNELSNVPKDKKNLQPYLNSIGSSCPEVSKKSYLIKHNSHNLSTYTKRINDCSNEVITFNQWGAFTSFSSSQTWAHNHPPFDWVQNAKIQNDFSIQIGAFYDLPLKSSHFVFSPELSFYSQKFLASNESINRSSSAVVEIAGLKNKLLIKYYLPTNHIRPYISLGSNVSWNIKNKSVSTINNFVIERPFYSNFLLGFSINLGAMYVLPKKKNTISLEISSDRGYGQEFTMHLLQNSISIKMGF